jgi:Fic family protein
MESEARGGTSWEGSDFAAMISLNAQLADAGVFAVVRGRYVAEEPFRERLAGMGVAGDLADYIWSRVKILRHGDSLPLRDHAGRPFLLPFDSWNPVVHGIAGPLEKLEHALRFERGVVSLDDPVVPFGMLKDAMQEEAIASCALDGLVVDRDAALDLLAGERIAATRQDDALRRCSNLLSTHLVARALPPAWEPITPDHLTALNDLLVPWGFHGGDHDSDGLRSTAACDETGGFPPDIAPPAPAEIPARLAKLCEYITARERPVVATALLLCFWVAYERPFATANGRTARALFYAYLYRHWHTWGTPPGQRARTLALVSISQPWARVPRKYENLFRLATVDDNDVGYFMHAQLRTLQTAVGRATRRLDHWYRVQERLVGWKQDLTLNERQVGALIKVIANPHRELTVDAHRRRHGTAYETARTDLLALGEAGLLRQGKRGKALTFVATPALVALGQAAAEPAGRSLP